MLAKTPEVEALLQQYHPYYASHADNKFFVVLTQSCDLVKRSGSTCGARYISIAPVRPLRAVLKREFQGKLENIEPGGRPFAAHRVRTTLEQFLQRLFNNNEPPFFYFDVDHGRGITEEMCAMLALPIALKPEHYDVFLCAKLTGISDVFQAKLGWLIGQMYSRVGTPDMDAQTMTAKVASYLDGLAVWLEEGEVRALRTELDIRRTAGNAQPLGTQDISSFIARLPKRKNQVIDAVLGIAASEGLVEDKGPKRFAFRRALEKDGTLATLFR